MAQRKRRDAIIHHAERYGTRESKYDYLDAHDIGSTKWKKIIPNSPFYMFIPRDDAYLKPSITGTFPYP